MFNQSGFLTAGCILEQRQDLNSILFSSPSTNSTVLLSEMSDLLWHQECYTAHLHGHPSRLLSLPTKRLQVLCWLLFVCENLIPGHFCCHQRPDESLYLRIILRTSSHVSEYTIMLMWPFLPSPSLLVGYWKASIMLNFPKQ